MSMPWMIERIRWLLLSLTENVRETQGPKLPLAAGKQCHVCWGPLLE